MSGPACADDEFGGSAQPHPTSRRSIRTLRWASASVLLACGPAESTVAPFDYFALDSSLDERPHTVDWSSDTSTPRVDGVVAENARYGDSRYAFDFVTPLGEYSVDLLAHGTVAEGTLGRCRDGSCDDAAVEARPLRLRDPDSPSLRLLSETRPAQQTDAALAVTTSADRAVVVYGNDGARMFDVVDPTRVDEVTHLQPADSSEFWNDAEVYADRWLLLASSTRGLRIYDISDGAEPSQLPAPFPMRGGHSLQLVGSTAYLAQTGGEGGVTILDLSSLPEWTSVQTYKFAECRQVHEVEASERWLLLSCLDEGFQLYRREEGRAPAWVAGVASEQAHSARRIAAETWLTTSEHYAASVDVVRLDASSSTLERLARFSTGVSASPHEPSCVGQSCWLTHHQQGLLQLDLNDPEAPVLSRQVHTWDGPAVTFLEGASGIAVSGAYLYVADTERGLLIFEDLTHPDAQ